MTIPPKRSAASSQSMKFASKFYIYIYIYIQFNICFCIFPNHGYIMSVRIEGRLLFLFFSFVFFFLGLLTTWRKSGLWVQKEPTICCPIKCVFHCRKEYLSEVQMIMNHLSKKMMTYRQCLNNMQYYLMSYVYRMCTSLSV